MAWCSENQNKRKRLRAAAGLKCCCWPNKDGALARAVGRAGLGVGSQPRGKEGRGQRWALAKMEEEGWAL
jgi:hypothetical protein